MRFELVRKELESIPFMTPGQGAILYRFLTIVRPQQCLELGCYHGVSSCYIAGALHQNGFGKLTTIDTERVCALSPNIEELLSRLGLQDYVTPIYSRSGYNWELMRIIEAQTRKNRCEPIYDFCFVDGSHLWDIDGLAFFLVEKLLRPGGWLLFDDIKWTVEENYRLAENEFLKNMSLEQRSTAQVGKIFSLLLRQHPHIQDAAERDDANGWTWGWARKRGHPSINPSRQWGFDEILDRAYAHLSKMDM